VSRPEQFRGPYWLRVLRSWLNPGNSFLTRNLSDLLSRQPAAIGRDDAGPEDFNDRLRSGIGKTRRGLFSGWGKGALDEAALDELETRLLMADVGITATTRIIDALRVRVADLKQADELALKRALREELLAILEPVAQALELDAKQQPFVILMVGVNGVGKTTTIGKLAKRFMAQGQSVLLAAGDTFRAAAVEQLQTWGTRNNVPVISQQTGADSAAVIHDALESGRAKGINVVLADTAGRLHTADNLMGELEKIRRVIARFDNAAPQEVMLVVDATTGQNALNQVRQFHETAGLTGITVTKLDGTAKGGVILAIAHEFPQIAIRYIGVGEQAADLGVFDAGVFVDAILAED